RNRTDRWKEGAVGAQQPGRRRGRGAAPDPPRRGAHAVGPAVTSARVLGPPDPGRRCADATAEPSPAGHRAGARRSVLAVGRAPHPRRAVRAVAPPARADGRAADRLEDRDRRILRLDLPPRDARPAVLLRALGAP